MVSTRMIVKSGQKKELQNLGFRTYYNHCAQWSFLTKNRPKNIVFLDDFRSKMTIVSSLKILKFNRTPALYLPGYGMQERALLGESIMLYVVQKLTEIGL